MQGENRPERRVRQVVALILLARRVFGSTRHGDSQLTVATDVNCLLGGATKQTKQALARDWDAPC